MVALVERYVCATNHNPALSVASAADAILHCQATGHWVNVQKGLP